MLIRFFGLLKLWTFPSLEWSSKVVMFLLLDPVAWPWMTHQDVDTAPKEG